MSANLEPLVVRQLNTIRTTIIVALEQLDALLMVHGIDSDQPGVTPPVAPEAKTDEDDEDDIPTFGRARAPTAGG